MAKAIVMAACGRLVTGGFVGSKRTRQDNLWRGLPAQLRRAVEDAMDVLIEHGTLSRRAAEGGLLISIREDASERVAAISAGQDMPAELTSIWS